MTNDNKLIVYTDGSCLGNPGPGGWASLIEFKGEEILISGSSANTTNNRMEMLAVLEVLKYIKNNPDKLPWLASFALNSIQPNLILVTDSLYLKNGLQIWVKQWQIKNWRTSAGKPVKNKDLWLGLVNISSAFSINWKWVKGHSGQIQNEKVDKEARKLALSQ